MKSIKKLALALMAVFAMGATASAQMLSIGPRIGTEVSKLKFNKDVFDTENRGGFVGGLEVDFTVPVIGVGFDIS